MLYLFDGSKNGFLTAFIKAFPDEDAVVTSKLAQMRIGQGQVCVETDLSLSERAENRLLFFDRECINDLNILLRNGAEDNEQVAFRYLRILAREKRPVRKQLAEPDVFHAIEYIRKVGWEIHKFHGFIRFMETGSGALYAPFSPDNDICELLAPHFRNRLPQFSFVLHDVKRKKAAVYDGQTVFVAPLEEAEILLAANEREWQGLWKKYYVAVNIPSRKREKQMRGYMPARYWQFLTEKQS